MMTSAIMSNTTTNSTTIDSFHPLTIERISIGLLFLVVSSFGIFLHVLAMRAGLEVKKAANSTFHILLMNLSTAEMIMFAIYLFYAAPCAFSDSAIMGERFNRFVGPFQQCVYTCTTNLTFLIGINRALAIHKRQMIEASFRVRLGWAAGACLCWLISLATVIVSVQFYCYASFDAKLMFIFRTTCNRVEQRAPRTPPSILVSVTTYSIAFPYAYCIYKIWRQKRLVNQQNGQSTAGGGSGSTISIFQIRLVWQAVCIWVGTAVNPIAYQIIPLFLTGFPAAVVTSGTVLLRFFITPLTIFVFWKEARHIARRMLGLATGEYARRTHAIGSVDATNENLAVVSLEDISYAEREMK